MNSTAGFSKRASKNFNISHTSSNELNGSRMQTQHKNTNAPPSAKPASAYKKRQSRINSNSAILSNGSATREEEDSFNIQK